VFRVLTAFGFLCAVLVSPAHAQGAPTEQSYLPYGLRIAPGVEITAPPQPFESARHGRPLPNTRAHHNMVGRPNITLPSRDYGFGVGPYTPTEEPGSGDRGLWLYGGEGIYAENDAALNVAIPDAAIGTTIYAPTHMSPGGACMETVTAHWRYAGMDTTAHAHGFWDWCISDGVGGWQVFEFMDANWVAQYVRPYRGEARYWTQVYRDAPNSWKGLLYNFTQGAWEEKVAISGSNVSGFGSTGWTMWESHYLMDYAQVCPQFPDIRASGLQLFVNGTWVALDSATSDDTLGPYGQCWVDGTYTFRLAKKRDTWLARTAK
jgi:hypothetical protein